MYIYIHIYTLSYFCWNLSFKESFLLKLPFPAQACSASNNSQSRLTRGHSTQFSRLDLDKMTFMVGTKSSFFNRKSEQRKHWARVTLSFCILLFLPTLKVSQGRPGILLRGGAHLCCPQPVCHKQSGSHRLACLVCTEPWVQSPALQKLKYKIKWKICHKDSFCLPSKHKALSSKCSTTNSTS
jgi:hypothetical protein